MLTGMFLAIITYRPLFGKLFSLTDEKTKTIVEEKKEIKSTNTNIGNTQDALRNTVTTSYYTDGMVLTESKTDTVYHDSSKLATHSDIKVSKVMSTADYWKIVFIVFIMIIYVTMVYGPIAAFLVEMFPTRIRYTSMSLPYHIGNGVFGGLTPFIATLLTTIYTNDLLVGLYYPIIVAIVCLVIGAIYISNKIDPDVND